MDSENNNCRYFISYSGIKLPLNLVNEIKDDERENRNTYFRGFYDEHERLIRCEKLVYGEIELLHCYNYHDSGVVRQAVITDVDGEVTILVFNDQVELEKQIEP
ncbi:MAG: hypothetical protein IPN42_04560 [Methylococcaceae bacterium]|nr:hypothetical protein [Methylococcaceae bacterium]